MTRTALAVAALLTGTLAGCSDDGAPTDASVEEFCRSNQGQNVWILTSRDHGPTDKEVADAFDAHADRLARTGTPDGTPGDARAGFEVLVERMREAPDGGSTTGWDRMRMDAFDEYAEETCRGEEDDLGLP